MNCVVLLEVLDYLTATSLPYPDSPITNRVGHHTSNVPMFFLYSCQSAQRWTPGRVCFFVVYPLRLHDASHFAYVVAILKLLQLPPVHMISNSNLAYVGESLCVSVYKRRMYLR